jgi:predicted Zn-dependent peptidase
MLLELRRFAEAPVTDVELEQAVSYLAGQALVHRQSAASVAGEMLDAWLAGTGLEELADPAAGYRAVTTAQVQAVAAGLLDPDRRAEAVVRGTGGGR